MWRRGRGGEGRGDTQQTENTQQRHTTGGEKTVNTMMIIIIMRLYSIYKTTQHNTTLHNGRYVTWPPHVYVWLSIYIYKIRNTDRSNTYLCTSMCVWMDGWMCYACYGVLSLDKLRRWSGQGRTAGRQVGLAETSPDGSDGQTDGRREPGERRQAKNRQTERRPLCLSVCLLKWRRPLLLSPCLCGVCCSACSASYSHHPHTSHHITSRQPPSPLSASCLPACLSVCLHPNSVSSVVQKGLRLSISLCAALSCAYLHTHTYRCVSVCV